MSDKENNLAEESAEQAGAEIPADAGAAMAPPPQEAELANLLEDARNKVDENWNLCLRLQADMDNLRKRFERDLANAHKFALERFAQELLPVRDSLEMGLAAFAGGQVDPVRLHEGVELTLQMLHRLGKFKHGGQPTAQRFNPDFHQAPAEARMLNLCRGDRGPERLPAERPSAAPGDGDRVALARGDRRRRGGILRS
jgi:molecular chaperone GrpE